MDEELRRRLRDVKDERGRRYQSTIGRLREHAVGHRGAGGGCVWCQVYEAFVAGDIERLDELVAVHGDLQLPGNGA